eukprot:gene19973-20494_t
MQTWAFPARITDDGEGEFVVTFSDVPEALTSGATREEALHNAADALEEAILGYMAVGQNIPLPRDAGPGEDLIIVAPVTASRAVLFMAMRAQRMTNVALADRIGKSEGAVRRLIDGTTGVKIDTVLEAMNAVGAKAVLAVVSPDVDDSQRINAHSQLLSFRDLDEAQGQRSLCTVPTAQGLELGPEPTWPRFRGLPIW